MSSVGAEDMRSCKSQLVTNSVRQLPTSTGENTSGEQSAAVSKPPSRMDQYRASSRAINTNLNQNQANSNSNSSASKQMWLVDDKKQRMMAWINNHLNDDENQLQDGTANAVAAASSFFTSDFVWWKVFISNSGLLSNG